MRRGLLWGWVSLGAWFLLWVAVSASGLVEARFLTSPWTIAREFWSIVQNGYAGTPLAEHFLASLTRALTGFLLAILAGVPVGLIMGMSRALFFVLNPIFSLLRPIPTIAFIPLVILWFGIGEISKVLVIFVTAFLFIVLNTYHGVLQIPEDFKRVARNLGAGPGQMFRWVILPGAAPSIMTGLKTGLALSWAVVVAAELIAAQEGLGYMIMDAATFFRIPVVYIGVLLIGVVGFALEAVVGQVEDRFVHWRGR